MNTKTEQEIKVIFPDIQTALTKIRSVATYVRTLYIRDVIYGVAAENDSRKIRLRSEDNFEYLSIDATHKYKVAVEEGIKKEIEETLYKGSSMEEAVSVIESQGAFVEENSYEKIRILYSDERETEITMDIYPFGVVTEIEGTPKNIHTLASKLGFSERDYISKSADDLYLEWIKENKLPEQWNVRFGLNGKR